MSLRVWLPLNGDLKNKGLDGNISFYGNTGAIINENGKIGKCYYFDGVDDWISFNINKAQYGGHPLSFAAWVKCGTARNKGQIIDLAADLVLGYSYNSTQNTINFRYWRSYKNSSGLRTGDSSETTLTYSPNKWYHIVGVFENNLNKIYVDGKLSQVFDSSSKYTENWEPLLAQSYRRLSIGKSAGDSYWGNMYVNDVRIYDHALSLKQIQQIAKGLVLHYKLDNDGMGGENLLLNSYGTIIDKTNNVSGSRTEYFAWNVGSSYININKTTQVTISFDLYMYINDFTVYSGQLSIYNTNNKGPVQLTGIGYYFKDEYEIGDTINKRISLTTTLVPRSDATQTNNFIEFYTGYGSDNFYKISNVKLQLGSKTTSWCPAKSELIDNNIIYDSSGYQNNGTIINDIEIDTNSSKYIASTVFNGTNYIKLTPPTSEIRTLSLWVNWETIPSGQSVIFLDYASKIGLGLMSTGILCGTSGPGNYKTFSKTNLIANTWYHFVVINPDEEVGLNRKLYINGVEQSPTSSVSNWSYNVNQMQIGKRSSTSDGFIGKLSDLRLYSTVLSEADIKQLYQTSALIDRNQNLYVRELVEI